MFYQRGDDHIIHIPNPGEEYAMYYFSNNKHEDNKYIIEEEFQKHVKKIDKKEWIE